MLAAYARPTRPNRPMSERLKPLSCSHKVSIENTATCGSPLIMPISRMRAIRTSRYMPSASRQPSV